MQYLFIILVKAANCNQQSHDEVTKSFAVSSLHLSHRQKFCAGKYSIQIQYKINNTKFVCKNQITQIGQYNKFDLEENSRSRKLKIARAESARSAIKNSSEGLGLDSDLLRNPTWRFKLIEKLQKNCYLFSR